MNVLLTREDFKRLVFKRSKGLCVFCDRPADNAHHIFDRKLYGKDGGYYLNNGAAVCHDHHWDCETTKLSVEAVCEAAGIVTKIMPPGLDELNKYDKWGNLIRSDGSLKPGPLFADDGARKALAVGGKLGLFY